MDFKTFLLESDEKHAVMSFGRFNPVTTGHEKLMHKVHDVAKKVGGEAHVIASHSEGDAKNPIPHKKKLEYIKKVAKPGTNVSGSSKEAPSVLHQAVKLHDKGVKHLHIVGGSDRVEGFHSMLKKYNGEKNRHGHYNFKSITKHSSGERDPDSESVSGMSGTKMRAHAKAGEHDKFKSGLPKALHPHAAEMINHIKSAPEKKTKVKEEYKYEWGTPEGTAHMKSMTPGEKKNKKTKTVIGEVQHMKDKVRQDSDIKKRSGTQPAKYHSGLSKSTKEKRDAQFKKQAKMDDNNPAAYKPAPGDKNAKTKLSKHTIAYKKKFGEEKIPMLLRKFPLDEDKHDQVTFDGITTKAFDICPGAVKAFNNLVGEAPTETVKAALLDTDNYLMIEKRAAVRGFATRPEMYEFVKHYNSAYRNLDSLDVAEEHEEDYMQGHMDEMKKLSKNMMNDDELVTLDEAKGLSDKSKKSGIAIGTLRKVYNRGMAAWRTGHRPGTTPQQWGMARVNSYINKGKGTYHGADKDLREDYDIAEEELENISNNLSWEDIVEFYKDDELERENIIGEALSAQARLRKRQTFARFRGKRGIARNLKLKRTSDMGTLKRRANLAARRALYKRFLRGRNKANLSPAEKDRLEKQVTNIGKTGLQKSLAQKMLPVIRKIEQKRISSYRTKK